MHVILLEKIRNLGVLGQKVLVKPGYARNYLIPQNKAVFATEKNLAMFEERRADLELNAQKALEQAKARAAVFNDAQLVIEAQASDEGKLYGSVGVSEIRSALLARSIEANKREILLPEGPLYAVGHFEVQIQLHSDVVAVLRVEIVGRK